MRRVPEWVEQVVGGLSDGKDWVARKSKSVPKSIEYCGWIVFQAILFKVQPWLWHGLVEVLQFVVEASEVQLHAKLILVVIALLTGQTLLAENRFKRFRNIVESMDSPTGRTDEVASDGGTSVELDTEADERRRWWVYVVCGAITGGEIGLFWGPAGVIGLAVLGAMVGSDLARYTRED